MKKKYKKPNNSKGLCEASVGFDDKRFMIILCKNPAVWVYNDESSKSRVGYILCDECCTKIEEKKNSV